MQLPNLKETIFENDAAWCNQLPILYDVEIVNSCLQLAIRWNEANDLTLMS